MFKKVNFTNIHVLKFVFVEIFVLLKPTVYYIYPTYMCDVNKRVLINVRGMVNVVYRI